jgi:hypothetical protein
VRALGAEHFFVSSDAGLVGELNQTDTLAIAAKTLPRGGRVRSRPHDHVQGQPRISREATALGAVPSAR